MALSIRLASIFAHDVVHDKQNQNEMSQYFPQKQGSMKLDHTFRSQIIKFLSDNLYRLAQENFATDRIFIQLEELIIESTCKSSDKDLLTVLRNNGWNGTQFNFSSTVPFDPNALFLEILNLHLRSTDRDIPRKKGSVDFKLARKVSIIDCSKKTEDSTFDDPEISEDVTINEKDFYFEQVGFFSISIYLFPAPSIGK